MHWNGTESGEEDDEKQVTIGKQDGFINKTVTLPSGRKFTVQYTKEVYFNLLKHVVYGQKTSKNAIGDVVVRIYKPNGELLSQNVYKLKFKNNKNCSGLKKPFFTVTFDKSYNREVINAFKGKTFSFTISQADFANLSFNYKSISEKKGKTIVNGLYYINESGKKIKLKQANSRGKGDYETEQDRTGKVFH